MKVFTLSLAILAATVLVLFATTLLLELEFITKLIVRQLVVYLIMLLEIFIAFKLIIILNNTNES